MTDPAADTTKSTSTNLLRALRRRKWLIALCTALAGAAALSISLSQSKEYSASASLLFRDPGFSQELVGAPVLAVGDPTREAATNLQLVSLPTVAARAARRLGHGFTRSVVASYVNVSADGQSNVVSVTATTPTPTLSAQVANTFAQEYIIFRRDADRAKIADAENLVQLQLQKLGLKGQKSPEGRSLAQRASQLKTLASLQTGNAELVQDASVPTSPSSPQPRRDAILGGALGLLLGIILALVLERVDRRVRDPQELADLFGRPVIGAIPASRVLPRAPHPQALPAGEAEAFRMLRTNLRYFNVDREVHSVLITSPAPGDGKTTVSWNLAAAAASVGSRVLVIEADLRHPTIASRYGITTQAGLAHVLAGLTRLEDAVKTVTIGERRHVERGKRYAASSESTRSNGLRHQTMDVLTAGALPPNPSDLIESERMRQMIRQAETHYDFVVIDTPPTSIVSDAIPLVRAVSGVIVVTRLGKTTRDLAAHLHQQLVNLDAPVLGVVVNAAGGVGGYGYGYGYGYAAYGESEGARRWRRKQRPSIPTLDIDSDGTDGDAVHEPAEARVEATSGWRERDPVPAPDPGSGPPASGHEPPREPASDELRLSGALRRWRASGTPKK